MSDLLLQRRMELERTRMSVGFGKTDGLSASVTAWRCGPYLHDPPSITVEVGQRTSQLKNQFSLTLESSKALRLALVMAERAIAEADYIRKLDEKTGRKAVQA